MNKKIYIEAGANDGIFQSRSLNLYNDPSYHGILIEPIPQIYEQCCHNRSNNTTIYNCALVDFDYDKPDILINIHDKYSAMCSVLPHSMEKYTSYMNIAARTLDSILEENNIQEIDSFFLDVEGYEYNVLNGIDFNKRSFKMIEVECHYEFLGISEQQEQNRTVDLLAKYGYKLADKNNQEGNLKLIFFC